MTHGLQAQVVARVSQSALAVQGVVRVPRLHKAFCHKGDSPCHEALLVTRGVVHVTGAYGTREVVHATTGASCRKGVVHVTGRFLSQGG